MDTYTIWWLLAGIAVAIELLTGTFYLLMIALGLASGAVCAHLGFGDAAQVTTAALMGVGAVWVWHRTHPMSVKQKTEQNPDVHLDIGSTVTVTQWSSREGTAVLHRGSQWTAKPAPQDIANGALPSAGLHRIVAVEGNTLVLLKI